MANMMDGANYSDLEVPVDVRRRFRISPVKVVLGAVAIVASVVATAGATSAIVVQHMLRGEVQEVTGLSEMEVQPRHEECSKEADNCAQTGCCAVSGLACIWKGPEMAQCSKWEDCEGECKRVDLPRRPVAAKLGASLYCFAVYTANTGSPKKSYELELLTEQKARGVSIFQCAEYDVYSDVEVSYGPKDNTIKVNDVRGDWHFAKRKSSGAWVNTGMFAQVWKQIAADGKYANHNFIVKADPDAVFFPRRLSARLNQQHVPEQGVYFENCKYVDYGYFGNLEIFSQQAWRILLDNADSCYETLDWKVGIKGGKYGPMGEDLFAQKCMDLHGVAKIEDFGLSTDGACEADRPKDQRKNKKWVPSCVGVTTSSIHPLKKPDAWVKCYEDAKDAVV